MKKRFSFRLGGTSCTYPEDIPTNVRRLAALGLGDVELVLFDTLDYGSNIPDEETVRELAAIAQQSSLSYTVHLPRDLRPGNGSLESALWAIKATEPLCPHSYVFHLDGAELCEGCDLAIWQADAREVLKQLVERIDDPQRFCLENLELWEPAAFHPMLAEFGVGSCIDIGHLWQNGLDPLSYLDRHLAGARVIHLHQGHEALLPSPVLPLILGKLNDFQGVLTLEVFEEAHLLTSIGLLYGEKVPSAL